MAYTGASSVLNNVETAMDRTELSNKIYQETLFAFERSVVFLNLVYNQTIQGGKSGQFIVGGKADGARASDYTAGSQVDVTVSPNSERTIVLGAPKYVAERVDQFEEKMAQFPVRSIITQNHGQDLAIQLDEAIATKVRDAAAATGVAGNGDGILVNEPDILDGVDIEAQGDALVNAIYGASAKIRENDYNGEVYCAVSPTNYNKLVLSRKIVNNDYTANNNGGVDTGRVGMVGNIKVVETNVSLLKVGASLASGGQNNGSDGKQLEALVFGREAVGVLTLVGMTTEQERQVDFLGATLMTAYYANGIDILRPAVAAQITSKTLT